MKKPSSAVGANGPGPKSDLPPTLRVGDLLIRTGSQQVSRDGQDLPLPRLSYDLLLALVRAAPNLLTHDELLRQVWPDLVVSPETVTQRVKLLRDALGDDGQAPRYIGGVRGRGYRLLVPVEAEAAAVETGAAAAGGRRAGLFAALGTVAVLAAVAFYLYRPGSPPAPATVAPPAMASIAVLPFASLTPGGDREDAFAAGIHDDLLTRLAQIDGLRVISRGSVLQYRESRKPLIEIGRELGVASLLEGSVQLAGERVRINVQLIDAASDTHLWARVYDRELSVAGLLDIQADIARTIAAELHVELQPRLAESLAVPATASLEAYRLYLAANDYRYRWFEQSDNDLLLVAEDHYRRAIALDPDFALAHAGLGRVLAESYWQKTRPRSEAFLEEARGAAERALRLSPGLPEAYLALALYEYYGFLNYGQALAELEKAEAAMPGNSDVQFAKLTVLRRLGRLDECAGAAEKLRELLPRGRAEALMLADLRVRQGRLEDARRIYRERLDLLPDDLSAKKGLALVDYLGSGSPAALLALAPELLRSRPAQAWELAWALGDMDMAGDALRSMERDEELGSDGPPYSLLSALTALRRGDEAEARAELERLRGALQAEAALADAPNLHNSMMTLALVLSALGEQQAAAAAGRRAAELLPLERDRFQGARLQVELAVVLAQSGETEEALDALERSLAEPFAPKPLEWQSDPRLDPLREHPRFAALVARYGAGGTHWRRGA